MEITFDEFEERFKPIRNTLQLTSPVMNMLFERNDEEQEEFLETKNPSNVWSYNPVSGLTNGYLFSRNIIGYLVCKEPCSFPRGSITVKI